MQIKVESENQKY